MSQKNKLPLTGGCLCGAVRYVISELPKGSAKCHCRTCQKASGSAFLPILFIAADAVTITGQYREYPTLAASGNTLYRAFCPICGSALFGRNSGYPSIRPVVVSSLDDPSGFHADLDMWVTDAQPWDIMDPDIPKFTGNPW